MTIFLWSKFFWFFYDLHKAKKYVILWKTHFMCSERSRSTVVLTCFRQEEFNHWWLFKKTLRQDIANISRLFFYFQTASNKSKKNSSFCFLKNEVISENILRTHTWNRSLISHPEFETSHSIRELKQIPQEFSSSHFPFSKKVMKNFSL